MKKAFLLVIFLYTPPALANNCDKNKDDYDKLYCLSKIYYESGKNLNTAYTELRSFLNNKEKLLLKKTQLRWIRKKNNQCLIRKDQQSFVNLDCITTLTIQRTRVIRDRTRECKVMGCQANRL